MSKYLKSGDRVAAAKIHDLLLRCGILRSKPIVLPPSASAKAPPLSKAGHRSGFGSDSILPYLNR